MAGAFNPAAFNNAGFNTRSTTPTSAGGGGRQPRRRPQWRPDPHIFRPNVADADDDLFLAVLGTPDWPTK